MKEKKEKETSYVKPSQSESNHWPSTTVIGLITVSQMQLAGCGNEILQQEIHSVSFNLSQEQTTLREDGAPRSYSPVQKLQVHRGCRSHAGPYNHTGRLPANFHLESSLIAQRRLLYANHRLFHFLVLCCCFLTELKQINKKNWIYLSLKERLLLTITKENMSF